MDNQKIDNLKLSFIGEFFYLFIICITIMIVPCVAHSSTVVARMGILQIFLRYLKKL